MRRSMKISFLVVSLLIVGGLAFLYFTIRHEPEWFQKAAIPPGEERKQDSIQFEGDALKLRNQITQENRDEWSFATTDKLVNSWLAEDFYHHKFDEYFHKPDQVREIRVAFRNGKLLVACRYGPNDTLSTIVSLEAKIWLSPSEPNVLAVEFDSLRAGSLPFGIKSFQDRITDLARQQNIDVEWFRNDGKPTALLRFQADRREPTFQLLELSLRDGEFAIRGRSLDPETRKDAKKPQ